MRHSVDYYKLTMKLGDAWSAALSLAWLMTHAGTGRGLSSLNGRVTTSCGARRFSFISTITHLDNFEHQPLSKCCPALLR
jgi:hypothetical protein